MSRLQRIAPTLQRAWLERGPLAVLLWPLSQLYRLLLWLRAVARAAGWRRSTLLPVPVVVVGNLIAGGAGKTPTVLAVVDRLRQRGHRPGIVSRGHGRRGGGVLEVLPDADPADTGDEPLLLRRRAGVPVFVGRDRVAAAMALLERHERVTLIVADDGLQHHRLARDAEVIVFDERGEGNGWLLPAGPLREPMPRDVPPRAVVLYNAPGATTPLPGCVATRRLRGVCALAAWHAGEDDAIRPLTTLRGRRLVAAAGVARPERFFAMLRDAGLDIEPLPLPDHASFDALPWPPATPEVIVTEKDAVKLPKAGVPGTTVWVAALDFRPDAAFDAALDRLIPPP